MKFMFGVIVGLFTTVVTIAGFIAGVALGILVKKYPDKEYNKENIKKFYYNKKKE